MSDVRERIGRGKQASDAEVAEWSEKLFTTVASHVVYQGGSKQGKKFFDKQMRMLEDLDIHFSNTLPLSKQKLRFEDAAERTAVEVAEHVKSTFTTIVAATVYCPGWKVAWAQNYVQFISCAFRSCSTLRLFAVEGGEECKQELRFIEEVMHALGFKTETFWETNESGVPYSVWAIDRPGHSEPLRVHLNKYTKVEDVAIEAVAFALRACGSEQRAPNLRRCAIVSCPLHGPDGNGGFTKPVHDCLNETLIKSIDVTIKVAEDVGFKYGSIQKFRAVAATMTSEP